MRGSAYVVLTQMLINFENHLECFHALADCCATFPPSQFLIVTLKSRKSILTASSANISLCLFHDIACSTIIQIYNVLNIYTT